MRAWLACLLLAACTQADEALLRVPPASLGARTVQQQVTLTVGDSSQSFEAVLEIDDERLRLVAGALNLRLLAFDYDGARLLISANRLPPGLPPTLVANDLLLALSDATSLRATLPAGWTLLEGEDAAGRWRHVFAAGKLHSEIRYSGADPWNGQIELRHTSRPYRLEIRSQELP